MTSPEGSFQAPLPGSLSDVEHAFGGRDMTTYLDEVDLFFGEETLGTFRAQLPSYIPDFDCFSSISYSYYEEGIGESESSDTDCDVGNIADFDDLVLDGSHDAPSGFPEGYIPKVFELFKPSNDPYMHNWKLTWPQEGETTESAWVNVYGFFNAEMRYGGYGVIVRNMSAKPIAASVYFSMDGVTYLYQVLKGIDAGLRLALEHGCTSPRVQCNSRIAIRLLSHVASGFCIKPNCSGLKVNNVCQSCMMSMVPFVTKEGSSKAESPLLDVLQGKLHISSFTRQPFGWNKAAYFLAKQAKRTLIIYGWGHKDYKADVRPEDIADELLDILWKDEVYYNLEERDMILGKMRFITNLGYRI